MQAASDDWEETARRFCAELLTDPENCDDDGRVLPPDPVAVEVLIQSLRDDHGRLLPREQWIDAHNRWAESNPIAVGGYIARRSDGRFAEVKFTAPPIIVQSGGPTYWRDPSSTGNGSGQRDAPLPATLPAQSQGWKFEPGFVWFRGQQYRCTPGPAAFIQFMAENPQAAYSKKDFHKLWTGRVPVCDETIRKHLANARATLRSVAQANALNNDNGDDDDDFDPLPSNRSGGWEFLLPRA